jgi:FkbM family methyltransferase
MSVRRLRDVTVWWLSARVFQSFRYRARRGLHRGLNIVGGLGFFPSGALSDEERYLASLDLAGKVVYDVGAFIGLRTLFFATHAKQVISYEPNSRNRARLMANLQANPSIRNVTVRPAGVGQSAASLTLLWDETRPGECVSETSAVGQMLLERGTPVRRETISIVRLDDEVETLPVPDFIKVDVEGLEFDVLSGAGKVLREHQPDLFIELHGSTLENKIGNATRVLELLFDCGYRVYDVERRQPITAGETFQTAPSHIHCTSQP